MKIANDEEVICNDVCYETEEDKANTQLIASAPEMYKEINKLKGEITMKKILVFSAPERCSPCRKMDPHVQKLAKEGYNIDIVPEDNMEKFVKYGIANIPTVLVVDGEEVLQRETGYRSESELIRLFTENGLIADQE